MEKKRQMVGENWKSIRAEIEHLIKENKIDSADFKALSVHDDWEGIETKIIETFCDFPLSYKYRPAWLWSYFKLDCEALSNLVPQSYKYLGELIDPNEQVWFFVNDREAKFWFYEGKIKAIKTIIEESTFMDEFYIASKKYEWLLCLNHHEILIATGNWLPDKLRVIKERVDPILKK